MSGLCDRCRNPGRCCTGFDINGGSWTTGLLHPLEVLVKLAGAVTEDAQGRPLLGLPFMPLWLTSGMWRLWCPVLGPDGRCTDYDHRPGLCASYQAGSDPLCAEWDGVLAS